MEKIKAGIFDIEGLENVKIEIKEMMGEKIPEEEWAPMGPTPMPKIADLREWDRVLLKRYPPFYAPQCDVCALCTMGKCDLTGNKRGACGLSLEAMQGRIVLLACLVGASAHAAHGRHMLHDIEHMKGDLSKIPIDFGTEINVEAPLTRLITGIKPKTVADLKEVFTYIEENIVQLGDALHTGQEGSALDFESKAYQMGMLDSLGKEAADIAQMAAFNFPVGPGRPLLDVGMGTLDTNKAVIFVIGHNAPPATNICDYVIDHNLEDEVDIGGACCTAIDSSRYSTIVKLACSLGRQLRVIRAGLADCIVVDEQCIRADLLYQAQKVGTPVIFANDKKMHDMEIRDGDDPGEIVKDLVSGNVPGVVLLDPLNVGEVAVKVAQQMKPIRRKKGWTLSDEEFKKQVEACTNCGNCTVACPNGIRIGDAHKLAAEGDISLLASQFDICIGCGRCEQVCPQNIPIISTMIKAAWPLIQAEKGKIRQARGPIFDTEIRNVGAPLVLGTIPGIIAPIGCGNYPNGTKDVYTIAKEFGDRGYIVCLTGCMLIDTGLYRDEEGKTLFETHPDVFDRGGIINIGSCVSNAHIHDAAIKVANIFAQRNIRGNYEEIADYILNRVGACGVAWGAMSQKAASIATGFNRLGVPAVVGPHGVKYRRAFMGRKDREEDWYVYDARNGEKVYVGPVPEHSIIAAETIEECLPLMAKLCMRAADTPAGRSIKLTHYMDLNKKYLGAYPDDWTVFVRGETDLPMAKKAEFMQMLESDHGWKIDWKAKKILEGPTVKYDPSFDPTNLARLIRHKKE